MKPTKAVAVTRLNSSEKPSGPNLAPVRATNCKLKTAPEAIRTIGKRMPKALTT